MLSKLSIFAGVAPVLAVLTTQVTTGDLVHRVAELEQVGVHMHVGDLVSVSFSGVTMTRFDYPGPEANFRVISTVSGQSQVTVNNVSITQQVLTLTLQGKETVPPFTNPSLFHVMVPNPVVIPIYVHPLNQPLP